MSSAFDVVVERGTVIDGTGRPAFEADIGIEGDIIRSLGDLRLSATGDFDFLATLRAHAPSASLPR